MLKITHYGLRELIADLDSSERRIADRVVDATRAAVRRMTRDAQRRIRAGNYAHLPHLARSFTFDVERHGRYEVVGEAGAAHERLQGRLDVYIEHGTPTSRPHPHWAPADQRWTPQWIRDLEDACAKDIDR